MRSLRPLAALCLALLVHGVQGQEALRPEITALERMPSSAGAQLPGLVAKLRGRALPRSEEQFDLIFLLAGHYAGNKQRAELEALDRDFGPWRQSSDAAQRLQGELASAISWTRFHMASGHLQLAQQELQSVKPELLTDLPLKWRYRERGLRASVLEQTGNIDEALLLRLETARLAEQLNQAWRQSYALSSLALTYLRAGQLDKAREAADEGLRMAQREPEDHDLLGNAFNIKGMIASEGSDQAEARLAYEQALVYARKASDRGTQSVLMGNLADSYLRGGEYARALSISEEALPLAIELKDAGSQALALHNMGVAKIALKRVAEGKADVLKAITMERQQGATTSVSEGWNELGRYLEQAGDFAGAFEAFEEHRRIADTLSRADQRKRVLEAQEQFDADRRQRETQLLSQETVLQSGQIKARNLQLTQWALLLASGLAAVVLLVMIFRRMRHTNVELARSNAELAVRSERDPLTGLSNRRHFQREVKRHLQEGGLQATLFLLDIDHFKRLNDEYGHAGGDAVLVAVAQRLRAAVREQDLVVRWGGEEFLMLVSTREPALTQALALRMLRELSCEPIALPQDQSVRISGSLGFASFPLPGGNVAPDWERAVDIVDTLMYQAKGHGRNQAWGLMRANGTDLDAVLAQLGELGPARERGDLQLQVLPGPGLQEGAAA
ncbi:diguanylate cyclase (GGDEF)-like protein [Inhella inkyongensis]|uniref:diguanylate cyclase n=1 Tax=Inhella inkyongensis TaxID=392593 RepID=A0A840S6P6_9BURK|nr:GGDEF domain-containing protein [Inhella inkyongensis]MBB5205272.1 diguanylate cyclase (GGDEF)-like protein [Inhella inkyongensis]